MKSLQSLNLEKIWPFERKKIQKCWGLAHGWDVLGHMGMRLGTVDIFEEIMNLNVVMKPLIE